MATPVSITLLDTLISITLLAAAWIDGYSCLYNSARYSISLLVTAWMDGYLFDFIVGTKELTKSITVNEVHNLISVYAHAQSRL